MVKWWPGGRKTALLVAASVLTGCVGTLRNISAGEVGCPPDRVRVANIRTGWNTKTWTASCDGRKYQCSGATSSGQYSSSIHVACSPMGGASAHASRSPTPRARRAPPKPASKVERDYDEARGLHTVKGRFELPRGGRLLMVGAPEQKLGRITVGYQDSRVRMRECSGLEVLVNDVPHAAGDPKLSAPEGGSRRLVGATEFEWYKPLAGKYPQFALRACGREMELDEDQLPSLRKFLGIYSELAVQHQQATVSAQGQAPATEAPEDSAESEGSSTSDPGVVEL